MGEFFRKLFDLKDFMPRRYCGHWSGGLILLHNASDLVIWLSYVTIPIILVTFARRRNDLPFPWVFVLFGAFIIGCGFTHFMEIVMFYAPMYRFAGLLKMATAVVSMATACALFFVVPKAMTLRSPRELQREIDERLRVEGQLKLFASQLERSNGELRDFAAVASHDLQEPLRKIQAFGDLLLTRQQASLDDDGRDYLNRMLKAAGRMRSLIDGLLAYSQVTSEAQPFVHVSIAVVAREVLEDLEGRIAQTGGRVELGDLPTIEADPMQVRQLLQNLIGNGLKYHRPGIPPRISVQAKLVEGDAAGPGVGRAWELAIEDNGIGFDERYLDRIFDVFQRLQGRGEYEGTGMGLAICRKIVERHGGTITARSVPGRGATFLVTFPDHSL